VAFNARAVWSVQLVSFSWHLTASSFSTLCMIHGFYNETPWFWRCFQNRFFFLSLLPPCAKVLLLTIGVQNPSSIFRIPHGPPLGSTNGSHVEVYWFFKLTCCVSDICHNYDISLVLTFWENDKIRALHCRQPVLRIEIYVNGCVFRVPRMVSSYYGRTSISPLTNFSHNIGKLPHGIDMHPLGLYNNLCNITIRVIVNISIMFNINFVESGH
jgi:hypothetical protein